MKTVIIIIVAVLIHSVCYAKSVTYICDYIMFASPEGLQKETSKLELKFQINDKPAKSYLLHKDGSTVVDVVRDSFTGSITIIETNTAGGVWTTVISKDGESAHNRTFFSFGKLFPSQHYGKCVTK